MTEKAPERISEAITEWFGERCADTMEGCACCEAWAELDALEAAQARIRGLEAENAALIRMAAVSAVAEFQNAKRTARREALEEVERAFIAECIPGERRPLSSILDTIRALMEKPNEHG